MLNSTLKNVGKVAILAVAMILPGHAFAYTCFNPAICKAVCGAATCGRVSANDADIKRMDKKAGTKLSAGAKQSNVKPYTCSNPAICIAVCGKKTCGE